MSYTTHNINPKPYAYGCSIQIYWTTSANEYWNIFTKKKHICPNHGQKSATTATTAAGITLPSTTSKPHYYNLTVTKRTPYTSFAGQQQPKPKLSNSFELLTTGPKENIQKQYEMLSYIVTEHGRRVHGSQRDIDSKTGLMMDLLIYYEVSQGQREEVKQKFNNIRNEIITS